MYINTSNGRIWVSDDAPYYRNWLGRQAYKYRHAQARRRQASSDS